jgi:hypothetical protein
MTKRLVRQTYVHRWPATNTTTVSEQTFAASTSSSASSTLAWSSTRTLSVGGLAVSIHDRPSRLASTPSISGLFQRRRFDPSYSIRRSILLSLQRRTLPIHGTIPDYRSAHTYLWISPASMISGKRLFQVGCMHEIHANRCSD